jgi:type II secretory pathway component GspD/PulD (secretin)/beta-lactamase regulating signal transducer with metallopeptidase domain/tetratricopeptide (TPR) repeat protein
VNWELETFVETLGWTLLHFLWQGAAIAALLLLAQAILHRSSATTRYWAACVALSLMASAPLLTFGYLVKPREIPIIRPVPIAIVSQETAVTWPVATPQSQPEQNPAAPTPEPSLLVRVQNSLPWLVAAWLSAVTVLSLRLLLGWLYLGRIKKSGIESLGEAWEEKLAILVRQLQISRPIRLFKSILVEVPTVIGWLRPVILLPASSLTSLTPSQLEAILAHELTHIRRHDYLVNLLQSAVETLLFYHPAVWWVSRHICQERENCCDDLTVKICGDRIAYAKALATLEELRSTPLRLTVAASGGSLLQRIRRLMGLPAAANRSGWWVTGAIALLLLAAFVVTSRNPLFAADSGKSSPQTTNTIAKLPQLHFRLVAEDGDLSPADEFTVPVDRKLRVLKPVLMDGSEIESAAVSKSLYDGRFEIAITLSEAGGLQFERLTEENVGRKLAIIFAEKLLSAPRINERIAGKNLVIAGVFSKAEADAIALALNKAGASKAARSPAEAGRNADDETRRLAANAASNSIGDARLLVENPDRPPLPQGGTDKLSPTSGGFELFDKPALGLADFVQHPQYPRALQAQLERTISQFEGVEAAKVTILTPENRLLTEPVKQTTASVFIVSRGGQKIEARTLGAIRNFVANSVEGLKANNVSVIDNLGNSLAEATQPDSATITPATSQRNATATPLERIDILVQDARLLIEMGKWDEAEAKLQQAIKQNPEHPPAHYYLNYIKETRFAQKSRLRKLDVDLDNEGKLPLQPNSLLKASSLAQTNLVHISPQRQRIYDKLDRILFDEISFDGIPLSEVIKDLMQKVKERDPDRRGLNFIINSAIDITAPPEAVDPVTGQPRKAPTLAEPVDLNKVIIRINPPLTDIRLRDVLDAITKVTDKPLKYSVEDYAVVFTQRINEPPPLFTRTFKVDPARFLRSIDAVNQVSPASTNTNWVEEGLAAVRKHLQDQSHLMNFESPAIPQKPHDPDARTGVAGLRSAQQVTSTEKVRDFFRLAGINIPSNPLAKPGMPRSTEPADKAMFFNERGGLLYVRASMRELDAIESIIQVLNSTPPQINLTVKLAEITRSDAKSMGFDWFLGNTVMTITPAPKTNAPGTLGTFPGIPPQTTSDAGTQKAQPPVATITGVLTDPQSRAAVNVLEQQANESNPANTTNSANQVQPTNRPVATLTGILTDPQFRALLRGLEQRSGVDVLSMPSVTTLSGRQAKVEVSESKTVVVGATTNREPVTKNIPLGPSVDIIPYVSADGQSIQMTIAANVTEFLGYDDPGPFGPNAPTVEGNRKEGFRVSPPVTAVVPLARFRVRQITSKATVWDGQTLVLSGFDTLGSSEDIAKIKDKVPVLGDIPLLGRFFRSETNSLRNKQLILFVTPTIIDPAGNPVHKYRPFDPNIVPAQPPQQ